MTKKGYKQSEEHRKNRSGNNHPLYGKHRTEKVRKKIKLNHADFSGEKNPRYGKHCSEETKQKISNGNKGNTWSKSRKLKHSINMSGENHPLYGKRHTEESKQKSREKMLGRYNGENNPNWRGGISKLPYCEKWTEELREEIRERDGRVCQNCSKTELDNKIKLSVHHIHYKKEDCYPDLITLCSICNTKANTNRNYWIEFYMKILEKRGLLNYFGDIK